MAEAKPRQRSPQPKHRLRREAVALADTAEAADNETPTADAEAYRQGQRAGEHDPANGSLPITKFDPVWIPELT
jgi:hypothetical protein